MELEKVREFVEFAKSLNFTTAARGLHMSQPALSKHIKDLENELEVVLVERANSTGGNSLTPTGRRFLGLSQGLLAQYDNIVKECRSIYSTVQPARIQDFRSTINVTSQLRHRLEAAGVRTGNFAYVNVSGSMWPELDDGKLDFCCRVEEGPVMTFPSHVENPQDYGVFPLRPERLCILVGADNPLARNTWVNSRDLENYPVITMEESEHTNWVNAISRLFLTHGCRLRFKVVVDSTRMGGAFPIGASSIVVCTERFARYYEELDVEDVRVLQIEDFDPSMYFFLVYRKDAQAPMARQIIDVISKQAE